MAKRGLTLASCAGILSGKPQGWALCIGAGTSLPAFPLWSDLAADLAEPELAGSALARIQSQLSPNAMIETASERRGLSEEEAHQTLVDALYRTLTTTVTGEQWTALSRALRANSPGDLRGSVWARAVEALMEAYPEITAASLADVVLASLERQPPNAIVSFNAESLLFALINAKASIADGREIVQIPKILDRQVRLLSGRRAGRIPYYFCHGLLAVPGTRGHHIAGATRRLVFSETSYLQLSNASYSWQAAAFINVCSSASAVFVGMSMSDPNVRTWLAWMQQQRHRDLEEVGAGARASTTHYWLRPHAPTAAEDRWLESSVAHLGVRLVFIDAWRESGAALRSMLSL